ncbi:hypothetical protein SAV14893_085740 [Streptomyces avermitilis]|uniref:Uncharacterized protein n=1 Tax=Streptomyces avermitilis TaxID=33903 RepID=A0A4D4MB31_STRAX|nr:hypothetical protein SAVMC3_10890 [Streptomyces avermitilis]GDY69181.1 hypothetical protein SAV14893_085740 [Streptomyces avermitilis]GDY79430.1 hypothetical protein SAV31267_089150 [Streptomyces avermitilis]GDY88330.1 hypothetical protein SAVCW2_75290 [Streptomyces avermitilis]
MVGTVLSLSGNGFPRPETRQLLQLAIWERPVGEAAARRSLQRRIARIGPSKQAPGHQPETRQLRAAQALFTVSPTNPSGGCG